MDGSRKRNWRKRELRDKRKIRQIRDRRGMGGSNEEECSEGRRGRKKIK